MKRLLFISIMALSSSVFASEYGCKVLLCLSDPRGPTTESECVPPIHQLYRDLEKGRPFPTCDMSDGNDGSQNYAKEVYDPYDPCPEGMKPAAPGSIVAEGRRKTAEEIKKDNRWTPSSAFVVSSTIKTSGGNKQMLDPGERACVSNSVGSYTVYENERSYTVNVFDAITWQKPQKPHAIDVYINGKLHKRVRY